MQTAIPRVMMRVMMRRGPPNEPGVERAALSRPARRRFEGSVLVRRSFWDGGS